MENPKLALIPSGYKSGYSSGKVYSILPVDGVGDFDFGRGAAATRVRKDGLIETVTNQEPRLDWLNSDCPNLLLEPQRTNLVQYSEDFNSWGDSGITVTSNALISPSGGLTADKLQSIANNWRKSDAYTVTNGAEYSFSIYAKLDTSTSTTTTRIEIYRGVNGVSSTFNLSTGAISGSISNTFIENVGNDWYRIGGTYISNGSTNILYIYPSSGYGNAGTMFFWGAQVEQGSYPTSYIKTEGSTVTRLKDSCINGGDADLFNSVEGVIYAEFKNHTELGSFRQINLRLNSTNRIYISKRSDNGRLEFRMENPLGQKNYPIIQNTSDDFVKIAFRYAPNNFGVFINGVNKNVSSSGNTFASGTLSTLEFASPLSNQNFYGKVKDLRVYNKALTNDELIQLTTI